jgi:galactose mutarotase-like enzyme
LNRHGFAREQEFQLVESTYTSLSFQLNSNAQTKAVYPFDFLFEVTYSLQENKLQVTFIVENTGQDDLLFSVGAHPAFAVPFEKGLKYEDFYLEFNQLENEGRWPLSEEGLIETAPIPFFHEQNKLALKKELFYKDAIVLKNLNSDTISILSHNTSHGVKVQFDGFPYMGIWAAKDADFICLEPWCGVADTIDASGNLEDKEGIQRLAAGRQFERTYTIEVF